MDILPRNHVMGIEAGLFVNLMMMAEVPLFCTEDCTVHLDGLRRQRVYLDLQNPLELTIYNSKKVPKLPITIASRVGFNTGHYHTQQIDELAMTNVEPVITYDPYYHIAKVIALEGYLYNLVPDAPYDIGLNTNTSDLHNATTLLVTFGNRYEPSFFELLSIPRTQIYLHGSYWSDTSYWYIFAITTGVLGILYGLFTRARPWQYFLIVSMAAFTGVFATQLHQILLIWLRIGTVTPDLLQGLLGNAFATNAFPVFFAMVFMHQGKQRPKPWGTMTIVVGLLSFLLIGAGWFVGAACLTLSGILCLLDRIALTTVSSVR